MKDYNALFVLKEDKRDALSLRIVVRIIDNCLEYMSAEDLIELVKERGKKNDLHSNTNTLFDLDGTTHHS